MRRQIIKFSLAVLALCASRVYPQQAPQHPSPMAETIRAHERLPDSTMQGVSFTIDSLLSRPVAVFLPLMAAKHDTLDLLVHFHGLAYVPQHAVAAQAVPGAAATINLGSGSAVYEREFLNVGRFQVLLGAIRQQLAAHRKRQVDFRHCYLSSFSAGYGAIRAIIKDPDNVKAIDGIILLDGLHTDYVPEGMLLAAGGSLNAAKLEGFIEYARQATRGDKRMLITHSEIFPGTYASTTETASFVAEALALRPFPVLRWGPMGMQQISEAIAGNFALLGFAGNSAPDHIDHFHGLPHFLRLLLGESATREREP